MAPASEDDSKNIFNFFELPAELRNNVYDNSLDTSHTGTKRNRELIIVAEDVVPTHLLLVCHRFKAEFEDRVKGRARLTISDTWDFDQRLRGRVLPLQAARITTIHCNLFGANGHRSWIERLLLELPNLKRLTITLITRKGKPDIFSAQQHEDIIQERIEEIKSDGCHIFPALHSFDVFYGTDDGSFCTDGMRKLLTFDPERRRLENVNASETKASGAD